MLIVPPNHMPTNVSVIRFSQVSQDTRENTTK